MDFASRGFTEAPRGLFMLGEVAEIASSFGHCVQG